MDFLRSLGETFNGAIDFVIEKNKKFSKVATLKKQIKKESNSIVKAYITLGKHYYNELRDVPNYEMQKICGSIDNYKNEIKRLKDKLEEVKNEVNLSEFEDLIEDDEPAEIEATLNESDSSNSDVDSDKIDEKKEDDE